MKQPVSTQYRLPHLVRRKRVGGSPFSGTIPAVLLCALLLLPLSGLPDGPLIKPIAAGGEAAERGSFVAGSAFPRLKGAVSGDTHQPLVRRDPAGRIQVYLHAEQSSVGEVLTALQAYDVVVEAVDRANGLVQVRLPPRHLPGVEGLPWVSRITDPAYTLRQGEPVVSEGDTALRADRLRLLGYSGAGVRLGVISIGSDNLALSQAAGELPQVTVINDAPGSGNEGTALLELVHDLAPGAELAYCDAQTTVELVLCVNDLQQLFQADIIVDDLVSFGEPYFEDGPVAQAVRAAVRAGVLYVSSAGNSATRHYERRFTATTTSDYALHDFGLAVGSGADTELDILVAPGTSVLIALQWNDRFGASANDYDLMLVDGSGWPIGVSAAVQDGDDLPLEGVIITNLSAEPEQAGIVIEKYSGLDRRLEMYLWSLSGAGFRMLEHQVASGSVFGHAAVPGVLAVGAVDVNDPGLDDIEPFSSRGPSVIFYPTYEIRSKPDLTATDGVSVSPDSDFYSPFYGTSAAAPHVAAIGALLMEARPGAVAEEIATALRATATDLGAPGNDQTFGAGLVDALAAEADLAVADIRANGADGPLALASGASVSITLDLDASAQRERYADWWLVAATPSGDWYYYQYPDAWIDAGTALGAVLPAYQGVLSDIQGFSALTLGGLPAGDYTFFFGVDTDGDGVLSMDRVYYDGVAVTVGP